MTAAPDPRPLTSLLEPVDLGRMRRARSKRLDDCLEAHGLDAVVAFEYANTRYLSDLRPLWAPNFVVRQAAVKAKGVDRVVVFVHQDDTPHRRATMHWVEPTDVREFPTGAVISGAPGAALRALRDALDELGVSPASRVGVDIGTVASLDELRAAVAPRQVLDVAACMRDARGVKNEDELGIMRFASAVSDLAMETAIGAISPGVRECEVLAEAMRVFYRYGAEVPQCNLIVCSGPNTMPMQRFAGERAIERGDLVMLDLGACFNGLFSELARSTVCGEAHPRQREVHRVARAIHEATIAALVADAEPAAVQAAGAEAYLASPFRGRMQRMVIAHGIGVGYAEAPFVPPPDGPPASGPRLAVGATLSVVPTLLVPDVPGGGGVRIEDVIAITPTGPERLTRAPYDDRLS